MAKPRRTLPEQYIPVGYLAAAIVIAALVLPSILRPPQDLQSETASFSPDAPPDDAPPEALLQTIRQASSSTAGARAVVEEIVQEAPPLPPVIPKPSRGRCFGDPPRQTESLYSALCVPAWTGGDNGGATWRGVTGDEIRIGVSVGQTSDIEEGPLQSEFAADDSEIEHDLKVWQLYFNERFEFYGRYMRFYVIKQSLADEDQHRASIEKADQEYKVFAMLNGQTAATAMNETIRRGIIDFGALHNPGKWFSDGHPYAFSFITDSDNLILANTELVCKHFAGKPPGDLNEKRDVTFDYNAPRKFGLIIYQDPTRTGANEFISNEMRKCGVEFLATQEYNLTDNQQNIAGSVTKMKAAGVTTIMLGVEGLTPSVLTEEASRASYYPEWIHFGSGGIDGNGAGRLMNDDQAKHIIGTSFTEIARPSKDQDWFRAYKEIDPDGDPSSSRFRSLQQISGGIQHAGPNLTPHTLWEGLKKQPWREPDPTWSIGGGYRERGDQGIHPSIRAQGDFTYMDFFSLIWFDQAGDDPNSSFSGAWRHLHAGRRYQIGEIPTEPLPWFTDGITSPEKGVQG